MCDGTADFQATSESGWGISAICASAAAGRGPRGPKRYWPAPGPRRYRRRRRREVDSGAARRRGRKSARSRDRRVPPAPPGRPISSATVPPAIPRAAHPGPARKPVQRIGQRHKLGSRSLIIHDAHACRMIDQDEQRAPFSRGSEPNRDRLEKRRRQRGKCQRSQ